MKIKIAYITPFNIKKEAKLKLSERLLWYRNLESYNLANAIDADMYYGSKDNMCRLLKNQRNFWKNYHVVIILNFPTFPEIKQNNWYYDYYLPDMIRESNPSVKIGIHTEGWPSQFMKNTNLLIVSQVIRWLKFADFIISTERKLDINFYKAFNENVFYIPYPVPKKVRLKNGVIQDIVKCRKDGENRKDIVLVAGRWYIGEVNGYSTLVLAGKIAKQFNMKIKLIDDIPKKLLPKIKGKHLLEINSGLPLSRIIWKRGCLGWEEYHKSIADCRLMINLNDKHTFGRAGIDCAITQVPMVAYNCVETAKRLFPKTTVPMYDFIKAEKVAKALLQDKGFWQSVVEYADIKLSHYSHENCMKTFFRSVIPEVLGKSYINDN